MEQIGRFRGSLAISVAALARVQLGAEAMPRRSEILAELEKTNENEARLAALNNQELNPTTAALLRRDLDELEDAMEALRRELVLHGAPRGVIGAAGASTSQVHLEALLDLPAAGFERARHPRTGRLISEPGFRGGAPLEMGRGQAYHARRLSGSTFPDIFGTETATGRSVAMELKTPREGETVASFFLRADVIRDFTTEIAGRFEHLPPGTVQQLVIDLRPSGQSTQRALTDLSSVLTNYGGRGDWRRVFEGVRFITGTFEAPVLSPLQAIP